jgi:hypothetical protein
MGGNVDQTRHFAVVTGFTDDRPAVAVTDQNQKYPNSAHPFARSADGYLTIAPQYYHSDFAADLPAAVNTAALVGICACASKSACAAGRSAAKSL